MTSAIRACAAAFAMMLAVTAGAATAATKAAPDPGFEARDAYYSGEVERAFALADPAGERWVAGLAAWRLGQFADAYRRFQSVAEDPSEGDWLRAGAAFWASRAAVEAGAPEFEYGYLMMAASKPWTFYGMIAEAKLGLTPKAVFPYVVSPPNLQFAGASDNIAQLIRMANAEPFTISYGDDSSAYDLRPALPIGFDPSSFPIPALAPSGGFNFDPAFIYAIVRQESRFNPEARSPAGATGLMQLMPATAALVAGDDSLRRNTSPLRDPAYNLRLGQNYLSMLIYGTVGDDMLRVLAAYNGGPGNLQKTLDRLPTDLDPLLLIESLPAKETRAYVEEVMASYWLYRRQFGQDTPSLQALARGEKMVSFTLDR